MIEVKDFEAMKVVPPFVGPSNKTPLPIKK